MNIQYNQRGEWMKRARQSAGISQHELSKATGIKQSNISRYERGLYDIPATILVYLNTKHDINLAFMLYGLFPIRQNERLIRKVKDGE